MTKQTPKQTPATTKPAKADIQATPTTDAPKPATQPVNGPSRVFGGYQVNFRLPTEEHVAALDGWLLSQGYTSRPDGFAAIAEAWAGAHSPELSARLDAAIIASVTAEAEEKVRKEKEAAEKRLAEAQAKLQAITDDPRLKAARERMAKRGGT